MGVTVTRWKLGDKRHNVTSGLSGATPRRQHVERQSVLKLVLYYYIVYVISFLPGLLQWFLADYYDSYMFMETQGREFFWSLLGWSETFYQVGFAVIGPIATLGVIWRGGIGGCGGTDSGGAGGWVDGGVEGSDIRRMTQESVIGLTDDELKTSDENARVKFHLVAVEWRS